MHSRMKMMSGFCVGVRQYDSIPEDTRDFGLIKAKKALKKKMPTRNPESAVLE